MPGVPSVTVGIWVESGSRFEQRRQGGISHFLEHLLFKGTERRTAAQIAEEIDAVGGVLNAFTGKEYTCYYARVLAEHADPRHRPARRPLPALALRRRRDRPRAQGRPAGDLAERGHAGRLHPRPVQPALLARSIRSASRCAAPRETVQGLARQRLPRLPRRPLPARPADRRRRRRHHARRARASGRRATSAHLRGHAVVGRRRAAAPARGVFRVEKPLEQVHLCVGDPGRRPGRRRALRRLRAQHCPRRRHELAPLPGDPRETRPRLLGVLVPLVVPRRRLPRHLRRYVAASGSRRSSA